MAPPRFALTGARVLDGEGGEVTGATLLVDAGRIVAAAAGLAVPSEYAVRYDVGGRTVMPGLIDTHTHLIGGEPLPYGDYPTSRRLGEPEGLHAFRTVEAARRTLLAGVTTVRVLGCRAYLDVHLREAVAAGWVAGPRIVAAGLGITPTGGHVHWRCLTADGEDAVRRAVREHVAHGVDWIKVMGVTGGLASPGQDPRLPQYRLEEVRAAVDEAHRWGRPVAAHAHARAGIEIALEAGVDTLEHGTFLDGALAAQMARQGTWLVPTLAVGHFLQEAQARGDVPLAQAARQRELEAMGFVVPGMQERMRLAREAGVPVVTGTDAGGNALFRHGSVGLEMLLLAACGYTAREVLAAATAQAARALRLERVTGAVRPGLAADLLVVDGDPLQDLQVLAPGEPQRIDGIIAAGRIVRWDGQDLI
ncbi:MAG: amidohydrolase family protein [Armatimonadota bacterium]|nr:amidohydrolase family protein [Armatimonadota bacterium]MDR7485082.1 amidohydrolase family protein [Armatimonadota bacterium]MDR7537029.1 amidohydrolase family protein [Armatimonadota bacterium]